jgi:hypothetical protein
VQLNKFRLSSSQICFEIASLRTILWSIWDMVLAESTGIEGMADKEARPSLSAAVLGSVRTIEMEQDQTAGATELEAIATVVLHEAERRRGDGRSLLALLRLLEALHREIRDGLFQESLPVNRQALYALLKDMEAEGGWPYIHRMKLKEILVNLLKESGEDNVPAQEPSKHG